MESIPALASSDLSFHSISTEESGGRHSNTLDASCFRWPSANDNSFQPMETKLRDSVGSEEIGRNENVAKDKLIRNRLASHEITSGPKTLKSICSISSEPKISPKNSPNPNRKNNPSEKAHPTQNDEFEGWFR